MYLHDLVSVSQKIRATAKKKEKVSLIAELLRKSRGREIALAACFLSGRIPLDKLGVGWRTIQEAINDLQVSETPLKILDVARYLEGLSKEKGSGSVERKTRILRELFSRCSGDERSFLIGLLMGEIRQGASEGLVVEAIALASSLPVGNIRRALMFADHVGEVAAAALEEGTAGMGRFGPRLFHPIAPMLASPAEETRDAIDRLGEAAWEFKIDGARIQIHKGGDEVRVFTRHLKEITHSLPEIVESARRLRMGEAIFEGEVVALRSDGKPLPFQTTMRRFGRILNVAQMQDKIPLTPYFFDLLYLDGEPLFQRPYADRFSLLSHQLPPGYAIERLVTAQENQAEDFLAKSIAAGHEGLMAKGLDSPYLAGQRGFHWLKIKAARTLDLVVIGAEWGHGRRKGWLSNLHLGARDPESGRFVMLGKTFKGLTDEMLRWQTEKLLALEIERDAYTVYVRPELVVEIAYSDLQESPRYPGGLALRFARVKRFRHDKTGAEVDTIGTVRDIFEASLG